MKRILKQFLYRFGLGPLAERLYFNVKTATPTVLWREVVVRIGRSTGLPVPPGHLIYDVIACRWADVYLKSGRLLADNLKETLTELDRLPVDGQRILDFGCGCGRLTRHLLSDFEAEIYGSDYNARLVEWCHDNLVDARFSVNELAPPLPYEAASFDLVVARSVLTHLTEEIQLEWIEEMARVIKPGGLFYFSMHGPELAAGLGPDQRRRFDEGQLVVTYTEAEGANLCSSYASPEFVRRRFLRRFALIRYEPGRPIAHLRQDVYVLQRENSMVR